VCRVYTKQRPKKQQAAAAGPARETRHSLQTQGKIPLRRFPAALSCRGDLVSHMSLPASKRARQSPVASERWRGESSEAVARAKGVRGMAQHTSARASSALCVITRERVLRGTSALTLSRVKKGESENRGF